MLWEHEPQASVSTAFSSSQRCYISSCILSSLRFASGFNFNLTYGLKPQVSGIKIVTVHRRSIFQVEWLTATLISLIFKIRI